MPVRVYCDAGTGSVILGQVYCDAGVAVLIAVCWSL